MAIVAEVIKFPEHICQVCRKREATLLCDRVTGEYKWAGHPPKRTMKMNGLITCDTMLCKKCATNIAGADYCPDCLKLIRNHPRRDS
jgi:hypothetical protein